jgi:hypothetical protein
MKADYPVEVRGTGGNTPESNLEFQITFTETNLRYLLGETVPDQEKISKTRETISRLKIELAKMESAGAT